MLIWRVRTKSTVLDFGSQQAAVQFLDNYSPAIREKVVYKEISAAEIEAKLAEIKSEASRHRRDDAGEMILSVHLEWLLSRLEFYETALPFVQQREREIQEKERSRVGRFNSEVNEVYSDFHRQES